MIDLLNADDQIQCVATFNELISARYQGKINAFCWTRELDGDYSEIVEKVALKGNITELDPEQLLALKLTKKGQIAREIILNDLKLLKEYGASPILNVIKHYERDHTLSYFPTDVYSFHVDRSTIPTDTFLCTYHGEASEIIANNKAIQKIQQLETREKLKKLYAGPEEGFDPFLSEYFFDLHYQALPNSRTTNLGNGNLWKIAVDHPESQVKPCLHRAPLEKDGQKRLLLIC